MDNAADKAEKPASKKADPPESVQAAAQRKQAKQQRERAKKNPVMESYYALRGTKLLLVKVKKTGTKYTTYIGNTQVLSTATDAEKKSTKLLIEQIKDLKKQGKVRIEI